MNITHLNVGPYGHTAYELRRSVIERDLRNIEEQRARRRGLISKERRPRRKTADVHSAFARAAREAEELQRLRATGQPWAALDFDPARLG